MTLVHPKIIDFAIPAANSGPCSRPEIIIVDNIVAGKTEKIPLNDAEIFESNTEIAIIVPVSNPRKIIFIGV